MPFKKINVLWIPHADWVEVKQRTHFLIEELKEFMNIHVIWYENFHFSPKNFFSRFKSYHFDEKGITIHHVKAPLIPLSIHKIIRKLHHKIFIKELSRIIEQNQIKIIISSAVSSSYMPMFNRVPVIFDYLDEHPAYWIMRGKTQIAREEEFNISLYLRDSKHILAVSNAIYKKAKEENKAVSYIPNGVKITNFKDANGFKLKEKYNISGPLIGYIGNFGFFSGLLMFIRTYPIVQKVHPNAKYLIVGDGDLCIKAKRLAKKIAKKGAIIFSGRIPHEIIKNYYDAIDIGMIPFVKNQFTDYASPIKLFEYSCLNKWVIATDLEEIRYLNFPNVILSPPNYKIYAKSIIEAISRGKFDKTHELLDVLQHYDWKNIAIEVKNIISALVD